MEKLVSNPGQARRLYSRRNVIPNPFDNYRPLDIKRVIHKANGVYSSIIVSFLNSDLIPVFR